MTKIKFKDEERGQLELDVPPTSEKGWCFICKRYSEIFLVVRGKNYKLNYCRNDAWAKTDGWIIGVETENYKELIEIQDRMKAKEHFPANSWINYDQTN